MRIVEAKVTKVDLEDADAGEPCATVTIEFMEYELQEMANQERERIERGLPVGDTRIALERYGVFKLALNKATAAKREALDA